MIRGNFSCMPVLCIVDVQNSPGLGFKPAMSHTLIDRILEQIEKSKMHKDIITVTEFCGRGETDSRILRSLEGYNRCHHTLKWNPDGSEDIFKILKNYPAIDTEKIYVCGVYTHCCVRSTARGLAEKLENSTVVVLEDASNDNWYEGSLSQRLCRKRQKRPFKSTPINLKTRKRRCVSPVSTIPVNCQFATNEK